MVWFFFFLSLFSFVVVYGSPMFRLLFVEKKLSTFCCTVRRPFDISCFRKVRSPQMHVCDQEKVILEDRWGCGHFELAKLPRLPRSSGKKKSGKKRSLKKCLKKKGNKRVVIGR